MTQRKPRKDPAERAPDRISNSDETIERAMNSGMGKVRFSEVYSAVTVPPGPSTPSNSRAPGANLSELEVSGARGVPTGKKGSQFATMGPSVEMLPEFENVSTDAAWRKLPPQPDDGEIPEHMQDVVADAVVDFSSGQHAPGVHVVEDI